MFSSISWFNVLVLLVIGLIVIGPERLPGLIKDVRAVALALRNLVADARRQIDQDFGEEFKEFQKPLSQINEFRRMGPRGLVTKALFDDDDSFFTDLENTGRELKDSVTSVQDAARGHTSVQRPAAPAAPAKPPAPINPTAPTNHTVSQAEKQQTPPDAPQPGVWDDVL